MSDLHKLLILEEAILITMAGNPTFLSEFPVLSGLTDTAPGKPGCGSCGRSASNRVPLVSGIKQALVSMGEERKQKLKHMLHTEKVSIRLSSEGKVIDYTF